MTIGALAGLLALNAAILAAGATVVWAVSGVRDWGEAARLTGLAYFVGLGSLGTLCSLLLVAGIPVRGWVMAALWAGVIGVAGVAGRLRGKALPGRAALARLTLVDAAGLGICAVLAEGLFRAGRLHGLYSWDAWAFWVPKAKLVYVTGTLDPTWLAQLDWPTYPPLLPILEAADFHAFRGIDTATLHLQFWVLAVMFVAALGGILWSRVPRLLLWPSLVLVLAAPRFGRSFLEPQADFLVDFFFVLGALLVLLWLIEQDGSLLLAAPLLAGAALTKREGSLFVACLAVAVGLSAARAGLRQWKALARPFLVAAAAALAWRLWFTAHHFTGDVPRRLGFAGGLDGTRAVDSLRLSLRVLMDSGRWSVVPWLGLLGLATALLTGNRRLAVALLTLVGLLFLGGAWVTYANPQWAISTDESLNPIVRYTGASELLIAAVAPLLLAGVGLPAWLREALPPLPARAALLGVGAAALAYPVVALAHGLPRFPSRADCERAPVAGQPVAVVFGRFGTAAAAERAATRAEAVGFKGLRIEEDGCGRLALWIPNAPDLATAESVVVEARSARLAAHAERGHV